jgi:hypothetical protein
VKRTVNIPKRENVTSISKAWNYAAKVYLRLREDTILFPPTSDFDEDFTKAIFDSFAFFPFTQDQIMGFEARHISTPAKNIKARKKQLSSEAIRTTERTAGEADDYLSNKYASQRTVHTHLPTDSGKITRSSVAFLYGAIVCFIMRDISKNLPFPPNFVESATNAIYCHYSLFGERQDLRHSVGWKKLLGIMLDIEDHGYNAASKKNPSGSTYCKRCSNIRKVHFVKMDPPKSQDQSWKCPHCQGTERLDVHFSTKHLRNIRNKILAKIIDMGEYLPIFEMVKSMYRDAISKNMEGITQCFREYESLAEKDLLSKRECYFMVHYDASKKWKKRSCYIPDNVLSQVEIADPRYFHNIDP